VASMCLAIPGKVLKITGEKALVDFGGVRREVIISLVESVKPCDYVVVHTGYAIGVMDEEEARETLRMWREVLKAGETDSIEAEARPG
jgi:hydrogenase expression/formation protein HypC